jgi:metallo-beta-lactamase family protein
VKHHGGDPRNVILFVGFQAEHTLGRRLVEGVREARIYGDVVEVRAQVESIEALSAHADRRGLLAYAKKLPRIPRRTFLVHGDADKIAALHRYFTDAGIPDVVGPRPGEWFRLL